MARAHPALVEALRVTARRLESGSTYRWSNYGMCNCGHLAQTVTRLSAREIHEAALAARAGDWGEQAREYCGDTGLHMDHIIEELLALGLSPNDLRELERLENRRVLARLDPADLPVQHHARASVVPYLRAWAELLEEEWEDRERRLAAK